MSTKAWKVSYQDALPRAKVLEIDGVKIPFLGLDDPIASKETYRAQDAYDRARLLALHHHQQG